MANWGPEAPWHERDVVVPAFRKWLEAQGWETETETRSVDVVAHRGNETIYAEVKGRTQGRSGAGLDTLYGQLLRRMPAEETGDPNTRIAVVVPTGAAEAAALRVPRRIRDALRIDVYAVSDDGQVERVAEEHDGGRVNIVPRIIGETEMARRVKRASGGARQARVTEEQFYAQMREACRPELVERVLALYEHAKAHRSRQKFGLQSTTVWLGEHDPEIANPLTLIFSWKNGGETSMRFVHLREQRTPEEMERLVELLRRLPGTSEALDDAVAKGYRTICIFRAERVLATDADLEAFKRVLDEAAVRATATD